MAACLMLLERMQEMLFLMVTMTEKEEIMMMVRGRKNPKEKRKML